MGTISLHLGPGQPPASEGIRDPRVSILENGNAIPDQVAAALPPEDCEGKMNRSMNHCIPDDEDGLRLLALSRIPRCAACPRLSALEANHRSDSTGPVPEPPRTCTTRYCAPLVKRLGQPAVDFSPRASSSFESTETPIGCGH